MSMVSKLLKYKYVVVICSIVGVLSFVNYTPGTWLTGWDDSHPEFNFGLNISRTINGVWREHRGLGLVSGLAHSGQISRYLFLWLMSVFLPASFLRYFWQFLMLFIGPLGIYFFSREVFFKRLSLNRREVVSFMVSLFYLLNLATLQTFYVPLETFTTQYGFLPWLFLYVFRLLDHPNRKNIIVFTFLNLASASQAFTPTLFFAYLSFVLLIFVSHVLASRMLSSLKNVAIVFLTIVISNLYWLLPFGYFVAGGEASKVSQATINVLSSEESFLMNKKYGVVEDVATLKGFLFSTTDFNQSSSSYEWLLDKWIVYQSQGVVRYLGYALFVLVAMGFVFTLLQRSQLDKRMNVTLILFFLASFFFLMGDNPPFGIVFRFFQNHIPLFGEALRLPFTKYSLLAGFTYACLFGVGLTSLLDITARVFKTAFLRRFVAVTLFVAACVALLFWTLPMFQGDLIYKRVRVNIPQEYFAMFDWFNQQKDQGRILKLPIQTYWSWGFYDWGYRGSGFTWYGIKQPTIDRAFDVWNPKNESVYRETSYAVYSNDSVLLKKVLDKYNVEYILLDESVYEPNVSKTAKFMGFDTINTTLAAGSDFTLAKDLGTLKIYKYHKTNPEQSSIVASISNQEVGWLPKDEIYASEGTYYASSSRTQSSYPFASVGNYNELKSSYSLDSNVGSYSLRAGLSTSGMLQIPDYFGKEKAVFVRLSVRAGNLVIAAVLPRVLLNGKEVDYAKGLEHVIKLPPDVGKSYLISIDDSVYGPFSPQTEGGYVGTMFLDMSKVYSVSLWDASTPKRTDLLRQFAGSEVDSCVDQDFGSYELEKIGNTIKLTSENNTACIAATKGSLNNLGLFSLDYRGSFNNADVSYCVYGDAGCLNDRGYQNDFLLLEKSPNPFTVQFYSSPIDPQKSATSLFEGIDLVQYPQVSSTPVNFSDFVAPFSNRTDSVVVNAGDILTLEIPKPNDYKKAYIYEDFDSIDLKSITHECNFNDAVTVDPDFKKILTFIKKELQATTENKSSCFTLGNKYLGHNTGYFIEVPFKHISGKNQKICLQNSYTERCDLVYKLNSTVNGVYQKAHFLIPSYSDGGAGYKLTIENTSMGGEKAVNVYDDIGVYPFPYDFASEIEVSSMSGTTSGSPLLTPTFNRVSNFIYSANNIEIKGRSTVVLDQAFENGWVEWCGLRPCSAEHVVVNNWANGWVFDQEKPAGSVVIFFWPQVLEYAGFIALIGWFVAVARCGSTPTNETRI
jgi:hypothetical protein